MAKKYRKSIVPGPGPRASAPQRPINMLQEALRHLRRGSYALAQAQVSRVLALELEPALLSAAHEVAAEAHFRAAMSGNDLSERLEMLGAALRHTPDAPKLHFHRGLTLWQQGRHAEASVELDAVAAREPDRRGLAYLRALTRIAAEQPWDAAGLTPAEANTLRLVHGLAQRKPGAGPEMIDEPLLGKGTELWQGLVALHGDATAAPLDQLKVATERNTRRPVGRILHYYRGVAAMRAGHRDTARAAWLQAQNSGFTSPALTENLTALLREEAVALAQEGRWQDLVNLHGRLPASGAGADRIVTETCGLAYYHLGYEAAQAGKWSFAAQHWRKANELDPNRYLAQNLALAEEALENWVNAAEAWREMVRRRPRKEDHPDYLTDAQVAALWNRAAECYGRTELTDALETCLRSALKYAPGDTALRLHLADVLLDQERSDAAETQLTEIIALEPQNIEALVRLGRLYEGRWDRDPMAVWRQVLAVNPAHPEARDALADGFIRMASDQLPFASHRSLLARLGRNAVKVLERGLQELPGHPKLLLALGIAHSREHRAEQAREYLLQAYRTSPQDVEAVTIILHELLHAGAGDTVAALIQDVRLIPRLLPTFWLEQARMVLDCRLGEKWAGLFIEEAVRLSGQLGEDDTRAGLLIDAYELTYREKADGLRVALEERIREEVPASGAVQYIEAHRLFMEEGDRDNAMRLLRDAIRTARKANDKGVLRRAEMIELTLKGAPLDMVFERLMRDLFSLDH